MRQEKIMRQNSALIIFRQPTVKGGRAKNPPGKKIQNVPQQFSFCARLVSISNRADVDKFATLTFCSLLTLVRTCALTNNLIQPGSARDQFYTNCQLFLCTFRQSLFVPNSLSYLQTIHVYFFFSRWPKWIKGSLHYFPDGHIFSL